MRRPIVLALTGALLILAAPATATTDVTGRNLAYLHGLLGHADLDQTVTFPDGTTTTLGRALEGAAARAGTVDLTRLASGQAPLPTGEYVGDLWVIASGPGDCVIQNLAPSPLPAVGLVPQLWIYPGQWGTIGGHGHFVQVIAWTMKLSEIRFNASYQIAGINDNYCFNFGGSHFDFPFADGVFRWT